MQLTPQIYAVFFAVSLVAIPAALDGQPPAAAPSPDSRRPSFHVSGIGVPVVPGLPFSATVVIVSDRFMSDGSILARRTVTRIARDSRGRTRNEIRRLEPESFHGSPALMQVILFDPETSLRTNYYPATHTARVLRIPERPKPASPPAWTSQEELGTDTLNGLEAKGIRRVFSVPASESGIGKPVEVTDEIWHSADLHLDLLVRHTDPRVSQNAAAIYDLKREEPPASLFELPKGYTIINATAPTAPPRARDPMADELP